MIALQDNVIKLSVSFTHVRRYVDPLTVTLTLQSPAGIISSGVVTNEGLGRYQCLFDTAGQELGKWLFRWKGDGHGADAAVEGSFEIKGTVLTIP